MLLDQQQPAGADLLLATVAAVTADGLSLIPDGETEATQKKYKYMTSAYAAPAVGDRVVVMRLSGTYVVLGKIGSSTPDTEKYVRRSGDTMTGNLTLDSVYISHKSQDVNLTVHPEEAKIKVLAILRDVASRFFGRIYGAHYTNGRAGIGIGAVRDVNGSNVYNAVELLIDDSGNRSVAMHDPQAWRSALNAVNKAGDTMTGSLTLSAGNAGIYEDTTAYEVGVPPSSDFYTVGLRNRDKNGTVFTAFNSALLRNGNIAVRMIATKGSISNYLQLVIDSNNNQSISVSNAQAWRKALGLGTNGNLPITVAQGGTGQTGTAITTTVASILTPASGFSIDQASFAQYGKLVVLTAQITAVNAVTSSGWTTWATIVSGKRPAFSVVAQHTRTSYCIIHDNGNISVASTVSANSTYLVSAAYLLP